jgi:hypothetical protein
MAGKFMPSKVRQNRVGGKEFGVVTELIRWRSCGEGGVRIKAKSERPETYR